MAHADAAHARHIDLEPSGRRCRAKRGTAGRCSFAMQHEPSRRGWWRSRRPSVPPAPPSSAVRPGAPVAREIHGPSPAPAPVCVADGGAVDDGHHGASAATHARHRLHRDSRASSVSVPAGICRVQPQRISIRSAPGTAGRPLAHPHDVFADRRVPEHRKTTPPPSRPPAGCQSAHTPAPAPLSADSHSGPATAADRDQRRGLRPIFATASSTGWSSMAGMASSLSGCKRTSGALPNVARFRPLHRKGCHDGHSLGMRRPSRLAVNRDEASAPVDR